MADSQANWKWCQRCQSLAYADVGNGVCPAGGEHDLSNSSNYVLNYVRQDDFQPPEGQQANWKWCDNCKSLAYAGRGNGVCPAPPAGEGHHHNSFNYVLNYVRQDDFQPPEGQQANWKWCDRCQSLAYAGRGGGVCPAPGGGAHHNQSYNYVLTFRLNEEGKRRRKTTKFD